MGLEWKLEEEFEITSPADKYYKRMSSELHHLPDASPDKVQGAEIHEGDWVTSGSVMLWNYTIDGVQEVFKEKVEIDEEKKTMTMVAVGGHVLERYKAYKAVFQVIPKGESGTLKISLVYEKFKETDGEPHDYLQFVIDLYKDLDKQLSPKQGS